MKIEQIYTGCLAHAAYYLESNGQAAIFDPLRETGPYLERAAKDHAQIKFVFETHFHADFVSGHLDLAKKTGAVIVYGPTARPGFHAIIAEDGETFKVGKCAVKAIHTPGHTLESTTYLITDESGNEHGIISGDTLFIGDVGRPDLAQHVIAELTEQKLAGLLYDSLRNKIMPLPDHLIVYPNHGAGSACGKMMSSETSDTLGHQKKVNYALNPDLSKEEFVSQLLNGLTAPPAYFPGNVLMNIRGYPMLDDVLKKSLNPFSVEAFEMAMADKAQLVLDTRDADAFAEGFIPGSLNIGLQGSFAQWVGEMIPGLEQKILMVTDPGKEEETITRLSRIGYDGVTGFLKGGFHAWLQSGKSTDKLNRMDASALAKKYSEHPVIIDIRKKSEYDSMHVRDAVNIPLNMMRQQLASFPKNKMFFLYCGGGYRSMIAASILKQNGWNNFMDVRGGFDAIKKTSIPCTEYQQPTTML